MAAHRQAQVTPVSGTYVQCYEYGAGHVSVAENQGSMACSLGQDLPARLAENGLSRSSAFTFGNLRQVDCHCISFANHNHGTAN